MKIVHIEAGKHLYGGARQVLYLLQSMRDTEDCTLLCPTHSAIGKAARDSGINVYEIAMRGDIDIGLTLRLRRLLRKIQPDIVHIHSRRGAELFGGLAARSLGIPCVVSRRVDNPENRIWCSIKYRLFDHVITISEGIRAVLLSQGLSPQFVSTVRSALQAEEFSQPLPRARFLEEFKLTDNAVVIAVIAQLIERKGHHLLLHCLPKLLEKHKRLQVLFFGQGPEHSALEQTIEELALKEHVQFTGFRTDLAAWLGNLDIVVHPAHMEGLGIALLQSSAAGVPVVASAVGGIPEAIIDGETGLLIPADNTDALYRAIDKLLSDNTLRVSLGENAVSHIKKNFSVATMVEGNLAIYQQVLQSPD